MFNQESRPTKSNPTMIILIEPKCFLNNANIDRSLVFVVLRNANASTRAGVASVRQCFVEASKALHS